MLRAVAIAAVLFVAACTRPGDKVDPAAVAALDPIARDYVSLILEIGEHEDGYVDAYYGPEELKTAAEANPRSVEQLKIAAADLTRQLDAVANESLDADSLQRKKYLLAHISAAAARLRMIGGEEMGFADEAFAMFGIRPELRPLESYDADLAKIDALVPGEGALADRVAAFRSRYVIPTDKLDAVMRAAIAECRARTARHIEMPENERFQLSFVTDKPWSGYN